MSENEMILRWNDIPVGRENAITYSELCEKWQTNPRKVRYILHELSYFDNGDQYILIRSSHGKGFYRSDNLAEISAYRSECINRARHTFAPIRKINRVVKEAQNFGDYR